MNEIKDLSTFNATIQGKAAVLAYFSHDHCNVCKVLKPKLGTLLNEDFPKIEQVYINTEHTPEIAGQYNIFTVPVVIVFFEGQESLRKSRNFGIGEISDYLARPYSIIFED